MTNQVKTTDQATFDSDVLAAKRPVLVDFYADWCGPCKAIAPIVEDLAAEHGEKIDFRKVDVDSNPGLAGQLGIRGIPTLILFKDGKPAQTVVGAVSKSALVEVIEQHAELAATEEPSNETS